MKNLNNESKVTKEGMTECKKKILNESRGEFRRAHLIDWRMSVSVSVNECTGMSNYVQTIKHV